MEEQSKFKGIKILIVEDDHSTIQLIRGYLAKLECDDHYAHNGEEAVARVRAEKWDIVFMDVEMPIMDGLRATELIRENINKEVPIIAVTAVIKEEDKEICLAIGMNDFLSKPIYMIDVERIISEYVKK